MPACCSLLQIHVQEDVTDCVKAMFRYAASLPLPAKTQPLHSASALSLCTQPLHSASALSLCKLFYTYTDPARACLPCVHLLQCIKAVVLSRLTAATHESCCMLQIGVQEDVTERIKEVFRMHGASAVALCLQTLCKYSYL